jgi:predicted ATPase/DNA-binding SARP family transcriptional activator
MVFPRGMSGQRRPDLRIELLGGFVVAAGDQVVEDSVWRLRKARTLVKLLALAADHSLHREQLIEALWPESDVAGASNNLRQTVYAARRALDSCGEDGAARLDVNREVLTLAPERLRIDVEEFEAAAAVAEAQPSLETYRRAVELYRGELLPEDRFEEWASARRHALRERHLALLIDLARRCAQDGDDAGAIAALQRALVDEPLHEQAHRELMQIYSRTGRRQRALAQFHELREALRREFADEPDADTRRLYQDILTRRDGHGSAPAGFAASPRDRPQRRGNLPLALTSFVGRERELQEVIGLARRHRLVTLTGPGGCGKTRLSLEVARPLSDESGGGVWLVELAGLSDAGLVASAVGGALGVESRSGRPSEDAVAVHIGEQEMVILLDNCEHLVAACASLTERLLTTCPNLRVLATSREPLHVPGEVNWRVPSLAPGEATRLFAERAAQVSSRFALAPDNQPAVEEICRRVDGIPLAIELAAARVAVLAPAQIAARLRDSLSVLAASHRAALTRQQTLTATLDWSHGLLEADEQRLLRRLGVFAGDFDLEAMETVCQDTLEVLSPLVDKSLVAVEEHPEAVRYRLLDTVRHYARARLNEAGEAEELARRHRARYLKVAEELEALADEPEGRSRFAREVDELRWALRTALRTEPGVAVRMAGALWRYWHDRGDRTEGIRWLEAALAAEPHPSSARARALHGLSVLALRTSKQKRAMAAATEAVAFYRESGDEPALCEELHFLGTAAWVFVDFEAADRYLAEAQTRAMAAGEAATVASVVHSVGVSEASRRTSSHGREMIERSVELLGELPADGPPLLLPVSLGYGRLERTDDRPPRMFLEQTFVTARRVRPRHAVAHAMCDLALATRNGGELAAARELLEEALALFRALNDDLGMAQALALLGNLLALGGDHRLARELHEESLGLHEAAGDARGIGLSLLAIGIAAAADEPARAWDAVQGALAVFDRSDDGPGQGAALMQLGYLARDAGRLSEARELQELAFARWMAFIPRTGWCTSILLELADLDSELGDPQRVPSRLTKALEAFAHAGDRVGVAYCERRLAQALAANAVLTPE